MRTRFTELVGCTRPVQQAAMPGVATPALAAAVADAGGLGMIGAAGVPPALLEALLDDVRSRTRGVVGVNFLMPFIDRDCVELAATKARVIEFFYGAPDPAMVEMAHAGGALVSWQIGSREEAVAAVEAGADFIVAQGTEAGGHVRGTVRLLPLLAQVVDAVSVPVLAAGGIATGSDVAAALAAGASGVRVGTRFATSFESGAHPAYVEALLAARGGDTVLTEAFSVLWPNAPHRVLRSCIERAREHESEIVGEMTLGGETMPIPRFGVFVPTTETRGRIEAMALYAGESVGAVTRREGAVDIVRDLVDGAAWLRGRA
jgi:nitronate monooxygenase